MFRNTALVLLGVFIATGSADQHRQLPTDDNPTQPSSVACPAMPAPNQDCSDQGGFNECFYTEAQGGQPCADNLKYQCRCGGVEGSTWVCSCRGDEGAKENDSTDVEDMEVLAVEDDSSGAAAVAAVSSLIISGAVAATMFGL